MAEAHPIHTLFLRSVATAALVYACEATLVRYSDAPVSGFDLAYSAVALMILPVIAGVAAYNIRWRWGRLLLAWSAYAALALVGTAISLPLAVVGTPASLAVGCALGVALAWLAWTARIPHAPSVTATSAALLIAWLASCAFQGALPDRDTVFWVALCWLALGLVAAAPHRLGMTLVAGSLIGIGALPPYAPGWTSDGHATGPDILLVTVDALTVDEAADLRAWTVLTKDGAAPNTTAVDGWTRSATTTLARRLHRAGYHTAAIVDRSDAFKRGSGAEAGFGVFHHSADAALSGGSASTGRLLIARLVDHLPGLGAQAEPSFRAIHRASALLSAPRRGPLFLWIHLAVRPAGERRSAALSRVDTALSVLLDRLPPDSHRVVALTANGDATGTLAPFAIAGLQLTEAPGAVAQTDIVPTLLAAAGRPYDDLPGRDLAAPPEPDAIALPAEMQ